MHKQGGMSEPTADLGSLMIRLRWHKRIEIKQNLHGVLLVMAAYDVPEIRQLLVQCQFP